MGKDSIYHNTLHDVYCANKKKEKIKADDSKHYPNKNEAALLRKLKAETGLSEEEIRSIHKYRVMLSDAQKMGNKSKFSSKEKFYRNLIKDACKTTGLAKEHPDTLTELDVSYNELTELPNNLPNSLIHSNVSNNQLT